MRGTTIIIALAVGCQAGAQSFQPFPIGHGKAGQTTVEQQPAPVTATFPFSNRGGSWCVGPGCEGIPSPTLDCQGSQFTGGATWACDGATFTKTGTPASGIATPFYPSGFGATGAKGVRFNGTDQNFSAGDVLNVPANGNLAVCAAWRIGTTGVGEIIGKDAAGQRAFYVTQVASNLDVTVFKSGGGNTSHSVNYSLGADGRTNVCCAQYQWVSDGASVIRSNCNGTDGTATTTAVGPILSTSTAPLEIGGRVYGARWHAGDISRVWMTNPATAFTQAQLKQMVLSYWGLIGSAGQQVSVTRATTETCSVNNVIHTMPNGVACVNESGLQAFAQSTNQITRSDELNNAAWADIGTPTMTADDATLATTTIYDDGVAVADRLGDDDGAAAEGKRFNYVVGAGTYTFSCYLFQGTTSNATLRIAVTGGTGTASTEWTNLPATCADLRECKTAACNGAGEAASNCRRYLTVTAGAGTTSIDAEVYAGRLGTVADTGNIGVVGCQLEALGQPTPIIRTAGSAVQRNADSVLYTLPTGVLFDVAGQHCATYSFPASWAWPTNVYLLDLNGPNTPLYLSAAATLVQYDGTNSASAILAALPGRTTRLCGAWGGLLYRTEVGVGTTTAAYDGTIVGSSIRFGGRAGSTNELNGYLRSVCLSRQPRGCE